MKNNNRKKNLYEIVIAALLHDIGKFMQRAFLDESVFSSTTRNNEDNICPKNEHGKGTHRHSLWTDHFFERKFMPHIPPGLDYGAIQKIASYHHNPEDDFLQKVIQKADLLSAGHDRAPSEEDEKKQDLKYYQQPLLSIFSEIKITPDLNLQKKYHSLTPLAFDDSIFPAPLNEKATLDRDKYKNLWDQFLDDLKKIKVNDLKIYVGALQAVLRKFTYCIPSSTYKTESDIPLYDHSLTTAAIASALYLYHYENGEIKRPEVLNDEKTKKFMLVSGDLSGIQKFIFDLKQEGSRGVSKILRGRSFLLTQMTSAVAHFLLDELDLSPVSKIMDAGGRFILLLPNTEKTKKIVNHCRKIIDEFCLEKFSGEVALIIDDTVELSQEDLKRENFKEKFAGISAYHIEKVKKTPLIHALGNFNFIFEKIYDSLQKNGACKICAKEPAMGEINTEMKDRGDLCQRAFKFGTQLPKAKYIVLKKADQYADFWGKYRVFLETEIPKIDEYISYIECINQYDQEALPVVEICNHVPTYSQQDIKEITESKYFDKYYEDEPQEGHIKSFYHIAVKSQGVKLLGILKSDLDNMGYILRDGFPEDRYSLSRIIAFSRCVNFFFTSYLNSLLECQEFKNYHREAQELYMDQVYTLFSGGDDLCLIGPWNSIIHVAQEIQKRFFRYTGENNDITISAGINFIKSNYPAGKAILKADDILEISKNRGKNCLTIFGYTAKWGSELDQYLNIKDQLLEEMAKNDTPIKTTTLFRLLQYHREYQSLYHPEKPDLRNIRGSLWISHFKYDYARNIIGSKNIESKPSRKKEVQDIVLPLMATYPEGSIPIEKLPMALFPVIYAKRKEKE